MYEEGVKRSDQALTTIYYRIIFVKYSHLRKGEFDNRDLINDFP